MEDFNARNVTEWKQMKTKIPLAPPHKSSSLPMLGQLSNPKITVTLDEAIKYGLNRKSDPNMDKKKLRRTISNRLSAQRSRMKKAQYINDMEKMVNDLEDMISALTSQLKNYKEKWKLLLIQNDSLQKLIEIYSNESKLRAMELEQKQIQVNNLKELEKITVNKNINNDQLAMQSYPNLGFRENGL
ncbi:hypothetical protein CDL12_17785 [Handroanthus impetiginosus]|uniref:BZIP domain-containing protein n=1 Tax=Handroanthus impetiginosus TaxID=429701 RepID=A0A2G9GWH1_9LAMI|nr:hypothetical protein CDL12_17785 [Handroanthus impetiginosus]